MRHWQWWCLGLILALGAALRLREVGDTSLSLDEIRAVLAADRRLADVPAAVAQQTGTTPLEPLILRATVRRFGRTELIARLPSAIEGSLTILVIAVVSRSLFGTTGLVAAALLAVSPPHVAASREAQSAALAALLGLLFLAAVYRTLSNPTFRSWLALLIFGTAALYSHYGAVLLWVAAGLVTAVAALLRIAPAKVAVRVGLAAVASFTLFAPWLALDSQFERGAVMFFPNALQDRLTDLAAAFTHDRRLAATWTVIAAIFAAAGVVRGLWNDRTATILVTTSIVVGVLGTLWATARVPYPFTPHQVLFVLPLYLLLIGRGLEWPISLLSLNRRAAASAAVAAVVLASIAVGPRFPAISGPDWRAVATVVENNAWADDTVAAPEMREALLFYAPGLTRQLLPETRALLVAGALQRGVRGWLIAPLSLRLGAAWSEVSSWMQNAKVVDLSVGDDPLILYGGPTSRSHLLREVAGFDLPSAAIARGSWLREMLQDNGPLPIILRFVDQLIVAEPKTALRNPELLLVVSYLAHNGQRSRAHDLAVRLAAGAPDWVEAEQAVLALSE